MWAEDLGGVQSQSLQCHHRVLREHTLNPQCGQIQKLDKSPDTATQITRFKRCVWIACVEEKPPYGFCCFTSQLTILAAYPKSAAVSVVLLRTANST